MCVRSKKNLSIPSSAAECRVRASVRCDKCTRAGARTAKFLFLASDRRSLHSDPRDTSFFFDSLTCWERAFHGSHSISTPAVLSHHRRLARIKLAGTAGCFHRARTPRSTRTCTSCSCRPGPAPARASCSCTRVLRPWQLATLLHSDAAPTRTARLGSAGLCGHVGGGAGAARASRVETKRPQPRRPSRARCRRRACRRVRIGLGLPLSRAPLSRPRRCTCRRPEQSERARAGAGQEQSICAVTLTVDLTRSSAHKK